VGKIGGVSTITAGVAAGLFGARLLGEFVPDNLAGWVCMFAAGAVSGGLIGLAYGVKHGRTPDAEAFRVAAERQLRRGSPSSAGDPPRIKRS
jgi:hypothetical protein